MALGMNLNKKGNNIKSAKASKPKKSFKDLNKNKKQNNDNQNNDDDEPKSRITTMKIDTDTLAKIDLIQHILGFNKHEQTVKHIINQELPFICRHHGVSRKKKTFFVKMFKR